MEPLGEVEKLMMQGKVCPYCQGPSAYVDSKEVYNGVSYGMIYLCRKCQAWCGVHKGTDNALGRLANAELRKIKIEAHKCFDMTWEQKHMNRTEAYKWLSEKINVPIEYTHIGMLSAKTLKDVIYYSKQFLNDMRRCDLDFGVTPQTEYFEI